MSWDFLNHTSTEFQEWLPALLAFLNFAVMVSTLAWVLMTKTDSTSAVAWCLLVIFVPFFGALFFLIFGYQHVNRPLNRKRRHKQRYRALTEGSQQAPDAPSSGPRQATDESTRLDQLGPALARLAERFDGYPVRPGNHVEFYQEGKAAYGRMLEAIRAARHHVHLETFIFQPDEAGHEFLEALTLKAKEGVKVRLVYDAMGSRRLRQGLLRELREAGGQACAFLPVNPLQRRLQINMRNHRKILVVDGAVGFVGGLNVGDEYLGRVQRFGFWRDTHLRLQGPAVADLQRIFVEDWNFASGELVSDPPQAQPGRSYFLTDGEGGTHPVQIVESGPDRELKPIREIYFAAILGARERVWIASPYFVPDAGLRDALRLAGYLGLDVRLLGQCYPDKWIPLYAARYYWTEMLEAGVKVYQYTKGMLHSKVVLVDGKWGSVGTANLDNRSLHLNFEVNCLFSSPELIAELERAYLEDLTTAIHLDRQVYSQRPFPGRLLENAARLLSPVL